MQRQASIWARLKLFLACTSCGEISSVWTLPRVKGGQKINPFAVNILTARAMQSTRNRQTALNEVLPAMNISYRGLHTKTWPDYMKKLAPALTRTAKELTTECARSVQELYRELNLGNPGNIAVSYDGSWMTHGQSSHIGAGTAVELLTGLVLDYVVLSNFCAACERGPKENGLPTELGKTTTYARKRQTRRLGKWRFRLALFCSREHGNATTSATQLCCRTATAALSLHSKKLRSTARSP